jgi:hypothetical protein
MSVHRKLMAARVRLLDTELKKSGLNKFAGYSYFELGDFVPAIQQIFNELGLCGVVSYTAEYATLTITDTEDGTVIVITSPMADANLKGAHPIQNLGAVESYQRRYLWMTAMEIVEHDAIDSSDSAPKKTEAPVAPPAQPRPPAVIVGKDGEFQMKVELMPKGSLQDWLAIINDSVELLIGQTHSQKDVKQIFLRNKQLFEEVKKQDMDFFKQLTAKLSVALKQFPEVA